MMSTKGRCAMSLKEQEASKQLGKELNDVVQSHRERICRIFLEGDVAVLFHRVRPEDEVFARLLGWSGKGSEVVRMNKTRAARFADALERECPGDGAVAWLRRRHGHRLFIVAAGGTLCRDFVPGTGFVDAPGTLDHEWMS